MSVPGPQAFSEGLPALHRKAANIIRHFFRFVLVLIFSLLKFVSFYLLFSLHFLALSALPLLAGKREQPDKLVGTFFKDW
jgi:hypothetical protein